MVRSVMMWMFVVVVVIVFVDYSNTASPYCHVRSCGNKDHTACSYSSSGPSVRCSNRIIESGLTKIEKQKIVDLHNQLRQKVAKGQENRGSPGPQPPAKYMPKVEWDDELATIAQRWADQCNWGHDKCRDVSRFKVGQNIAYLATTGDVNTLKVEDMVQMWYDEVQHYSKNDVTRFSNRGANGNAVGHYTQLVWAKSTKIGCGAVKYNDGQFNRFYLVCNYGPAGNMIGESLYETR